MNRMKIAILYGARRRLTKAHKNVSHHRVAAGQPGAQPHYYVRMKVVNWKFRGTPSEAMALGLALSAANPMPGETVLNTVFVDE